MAHVTTPGTCVDVGIQAKSSTLDSLKDGYKFTVKFTDGSSDSGTQVGQLDDLTSRYPGLTVKCVQVDAI